MEEYVKQKYLFFNLVKKYTKKPNIFLNCMKAFLVGGTICLFGQAIQNFYLYLHISKNSVGNLTVATLIVITCLLTGLGIYDNLGQWAGAGSSVPVTGFANSIASSALEHKSEGFIIGVGSNMFKLAGSVIVSGVVASFFIGILKALLSYF